jgi:hypothetical protein
LPLYPDSEATVKANPRISAAGGRASIFDIETFTKRQWNDINAVRRGLGLHEIESREIVFVGRYIDANRTRDGYTVDNIWAQIEAARSAASVVLAFQGMIPGNWRGPASHQRLNLGKAQGGSTGNVQTAGRVAAEREARLIGRGQRSPSRRHSLHALPTQIPRERGQRRVRYVVLDPLGVQFG